MSVVNELPTIRSCEQVVVTRVVIVEGEGVTGDPVRLVTYFYAKDGALIARHDGVAGA